MSDTGSAVPTTVTELRRILAPYRGSGSGSAIRMTGAAPRIGFVPTMGYLHEGHVALVHRARAECDVVVASIFVNPLQFGANEDFASYPRDLDRDRALLARAHTDVVFVPDGAEFYPPGADSAVVVGSVAEPLEGAFRPGHFRGVATVVSMLFNAVQPHVAYFGEKDWQQLQVIRQFVRDLHIPVEIVAVPTVRERDGLAMSSRNVRLSPAERERARCLPAALEAARAAFAAGETSSHALERAMLDIIAREPEAKVDYAAVVDAATLRPAREASAQSRALIAVRLGRVRLIDNMGL